MKFRTLYSDEAEGYQGCEGEGRILVDDSDATPFHGKAWSMEIIADTGCIELHLFTWDAPGSWHLTMPSPLNEEIGKAVGRAFLVSLDNDKTPRDIETAIDEISEKFGFERTC